MKQFFRKYKSEFIVGVFSSIAASALITGAAFIFGPEDLKFKFSVLLVSVTLVLMLFLLFNQKKFLLHRFEQIDKNLQRKFRFDLSETPYNLRLDHFAREKDKLAKYLVRKVMPNRVNDYFKIHPTIDQINVFIDSGTTLTPVFPEIMHHGLPVESNRKVNIRYLTNNLAGIDEIHNMVDFDECITSENNFTLIPGTPSRKYRATLGVETESYISNFIKPQNSLTIAIVTANWFLMTGNLDQISFAARDKLHRQFKEKLIEMADLTFILSPLGKLLRIGDISILNEAIGKEEEPYESVQIDSSRKNNVFLVTTFRKSKLNPLLSLSQALKTSMKRDCSKNFTFCSEQINFDLVGSSKEIFETELPHYYIRKSYKKFYG